MGNEENYTAPHGCYRCAGDDSWCVISVYTEQEWLSLSGVIGDAALAQNPKFSTGLNRLQHRSELDQLVERWTMHHNAYEVMERLQSVGVAAGVVQNTAQLTDDPHLKARGFIVETNHPEMGKLLHGGMPVKLSLTSGKVRSHAPLLGEHNDYILHDVLGLSDKEIERLRDSGVLD
jgi:crotonobetainyl-CoA:carnitine CoA-transferase CaiB-like acyl-CoA transferase